MEECTMTKLECMLKYVSEHNEFYKRRIKEYGITNPLDITQWPILTRKELQENRYNMFSDGYKSKYFSEQLRRQTSSGSSGIPVNVYWDYKDWYASNLTLWRKRWQWYGIKPSNRYVLFTLNSFNLKVDREIVYYVQEPQNVLSVNVSLVQNEEQYINLIHLINDFDPEWLYVQPFVLNRLINIYRKHGLVKPRSLKYVETVGEILTSDLRRRAIEFFDVPLANMYGSEEMNVIAYECPNQHMHVIDDNVFLESKGGCCDGETIVTNLNNFAMPLIRYNQGDSILCDNLYSDCMYAGITDVIQLIKGRELDAIQINHEYELFIFTLLEIIAEINNGFNDIIKEYIYEYIECENILYLYLVLEDNYVAWYENINKTIEKLFYSKVMFPISIKVKLLDQIPFEWQNRKKTIIKQK